MYLWSMNNANNNKMNNLDNTYKAIELGGSWIAEASGDTWTGKYYATEKGAQRAAHKANQMAGLSA